MTPKKFSLIPGNISRFFILMVIVLLATMGVMIQSAVNAWLKEKSYQVVDVSHALHQRIDAWRYATWQIYDNIAATSVNTASGGYEPVVNQMATEQAYYALAFFYKSVPDKTALTKAAKAGSGKLKVSWKQAEINTDYVTKQSGKTATVSGYQIVCATDKKFSKNVVKTTVNGESLSKTVTGLKKGKTYYVKVRAYKTVNGKKIYGLYSSVRKQKV